MNRLLSMLLVSLLQVSIALASTFDLKVEATPDGSGSLNTSGGVYEEGSTIYLKTYGYTGFVFMGWYKGDVLLSQSTGFNYVMPSEDVVVQARYEYNPGVPGNPAMPDTATYYNLSVSVSPEGAGSLNVTSARYVSGASVNIRTYGNTGFQFNGWQDERGVVLSTSYSFNYKMPGHDSRLTAIYTYDPMVPASPDSMATRYTVTVSCKPVGGGSFNTSSATVAEGGNVHLYAYTNTGYQFLHWEDEQGEILSYEQNFYYVMPHGNTKVYGVFDYNPAPPSNPGRNYWNKELGEVIIDDFTPGSLGSAVSNAISGSSRSDVAMITVAGKMNDNDFGIANDYTNCTLLDLSRVTGITNIPSYAFDYTNLESVYLPATVEKIGYRAFAECRQLTALTVYAMIPPTLENYVFTGVPEGLIVYVPAAAIQHYSDNEAWGRFTILPIQEDLRTLSISLPEGTAVGDYANMWLELVNSKNGQKMHYVMTNRMTYTFSNIIRNTSWYAVIRSQGGDVFARIENIDVGNDDVEIAFAQLSRPQEVTVKVTAADGSDVTDQVSAVWSDSRGNMLSQNTTIYGMLAGTTLRCTVTLSQNLLMQYEQPSAVEYEIQSADNILSIQLSEIGHVGISGRVCDIATKQPLANATVAVSQTLGGKYTKTVSVKTDVSGRFAVTASRVPTQLSVGSNNYISQSVGCETFTNDSMELEDILLKRISGAVVSLTLNYTESAADGETPVQSEFTDYNNVTYTIYNKTKSRVIGKYNVQYPDIVLLEEVDEGDELELELSSISNAFLPVKSSARIDDSQRANAIFEILQLGKLEATFMENGNVAVVGSLYDSKGKLIKTYDYTDARTTIEDLMDGNYTLVTMGSSKLFNTIYDISQLPETGLTEGADYVCSDVTVKSGFVTDVLIERVPKLDESKLYYTGDKTSFTVNKSSIVAGNYLTLTAHLDFKSAYAGSVSNVSLIVDLPESCTFVENSVMVGNSTSNYSVDGNRVVIPVARYTDRVRFCIIPTLGGEYAPSAIAQFDIDGNTILQPIGSANYVAKDLSIVVPSMAAKYEITVSGTAVGSSDVYVYDDDVLIGQTRSLANGTWSLKCEINKSYNLSSHNIHARVVTKNGLELQSETCACVYDKNAIEVSSITMVNTAHTSANLDLYDYVTVFDYQNPDKEISPYWYWPSYPDFTFLVDFTRNDTAVVKDVMLNVFTSDGGVVQITPVYDAKRRQWIATAQFDSYRLPTNCSVNYSLQAESKSDFSLEKDEHAYQEVVFSNHVLEWADENFDIELHEQQEDADVYLFTRKDNGAKFYMKVSELDYGKITDQMNEDMSGFQVAVLDEGGLYCTKSYIDNDGNHIYIVDTHEEVAYLIDAWDPEYEYNGGLDVDIRKVKLSKFGRLVSKIRSKYKSGALLRDGLDFGAGVLDGLGLADYFQIPTVFATVDLTNFRANQIEQYNQALRNKLMQKCADGKPAYNDSDMQYLKDQADLFESWANSLDDAYFWGSVTYCTQVVGSAAYDVVVNMIGAKIAKGIAWGGKILTNSKNAKYFKYNIPIKNTTKVKRQALENGIGIGIDVLFNTLDDFKTNKLKFDFNKTQNEFERFMDDQFNSYQDQMNHALNQTWKKSRCPGKRPPTQPRNPNVKHVMDPSGYVYEAVSSNRVEGVTATAYYKETVEDMYGDLHENIVKWDAEEYAQQNPLFTDKDGMYAWDVPNGLWQVKFEKQGYETTYSEWLPVPPPQLDINISMKQNVQPNVKNVRAYEDAVEVEFDKYMMPELLNTENIIVMVGDRQVEGFVELLNEEARCEDENETFASKLRFNAVAPFDSTEITLYISNRVKSYAGIRMQDVYSQSFAIEQEIRTIECDSAVVVRYGDSGIILVSVLPASASAGKTIKVHSSSSMILATEVTSVLLDEKGEAEICVCGELPGTAALTFNIDGYDLSATTIVNVEQVDYIDVAVPVASIASGTTVEKGTKVTLTCQTEGATIYYTLDGSCPCEETSRIMYAEPIIINESVTIKAMAVASDMTESDIVEFIYIVNDEDGIEEVSVCQDLNIYPVPVHGNLNIDAGGKIIKSVSLVSIDGVVVLTADKPVTHISIDVSSLTAGIYLVNVATEDKTYSRKVLKVE